MKKLLTVAAATTLALGLAMGASAQKIDANGRCHAANGEFAKAEVCGGAKSATKAAKSDAKADAKGAKADAKADKKGETKAEAKAEAKTAKADAKADRKGAKVAKVKCKNAKGKFAKCGTAGATPAT
jgi:hypothetical protein